MFVEKSAIIITSGTSNSISQDGLLELHHKPLINHVYDAIKTLVDEIVIVTKSNEIIKNYKKKIPITAKFAVNEFDSKGLLTDALTGFKAAQGKYSLLLSYDTPFVSKKVISLLFDCCIGKTVAIPRWSIDKTEPLQAVYQTKLVLEATNEAFEAGETELDVIVERLRGVRYISSLVFEQIDPEMRTFFRINTPQALKKAELMLTKKSKN